MDLLTLAIYNAALAVIMAMGRGASDVALLLQPSPASKKALKSVGILLGTGASVFASIALALALADAVCGRL